MSEFIKFLLIITIGICYCFSKICKAISTSVKAKYNYYEEEELHELLDKIQDIKEKDLERIQEE